MSDSQAQPKKKRWFDFSDIISLLDDKSPANRQPRLPPAQEPPRELPPARNTAAPAEPPAAPPKAVIALGPSQVAAQTDNAVLTKLLSDIDQKNAEVLKLSNELITFRYEIMEKDRRIASIPLLEASLKDKEDELALADAKIRELDGKIVALEARIGELNEQLGTLRMLSAREAPPIAADLPAGEEKPAFNVQEEMPAAEEDVASIFKRILTAKEQDVPEGQEAPRKPRSAKLYDL
jgi:septal ring factor EnvC (AmiA/AmiB activator)